MDSQDKRLLAALFNNSRQSLTRLAKLTRLSRENVAYRLERLKREGIIKSFITEIDHARLGVKHFTVALALHRATAEQEQEIMESLAKHPNFTWLGPAAGSWSIVVDAFAKNREELEEIFQTFYEKNKTFISNYRILEIASMSAWFNKHITPVNPRTPKTGSYVPDATDKKLLAVLSDNSRATYVELGKATGLSANACKYRLRNLEQTGIIQGYTLNIEPTVLGYQWYTVQITTMETSMDSIQKFYRFCKEHPDILFYYNYYRSGAQDFDIGFLVKTHDDLRSGLNKLKQQFPSMTVQNLFLPYVQVTTHSLPPAVFKN